jgi:hypothetical protein
MDALLLIYLIVAIAEVDCLRGAKCSAHLTAHASLSYVIELALPGLCFPASQACLVQKERRSTHGGAHNHKLSSGQTHMLLLHGRFFLIFSRGMK